MNGFYDCVAEGDDSGFGGVEHVGLEELFGGSCWVSDVFEFDFFILDTFFHECGDVYDGGLFSFLGPLCE